MKKKSRLLFVFLGSLFFFASTDLFGQVDFYERIPEQEQERYWERTWDRLRENSSSEQIIARRAQILRDAQDQVDQDYFQGAPENFKTGFYFTGSAWGGFYNFDQSNFLYGAGPLVTLGAEFFLNSYASLSAETGIGFFIRGSQGRSSGGRESLNCYYINGVYYCEPWDYFVFNYDFLVAPALVLRFYLTGSENKSISLAVHASPFWFTVGEFNEYLNFDAGFSVGANVDIYGLVLGYTYFNTSYWSFQWNHGVEVHAFQLGYRYGVKMNSSGERKIY